MRQSTMCHKEPYIHLSSCSLDAHIGSGELNVLTWKILKLTKDVKWMNFKCTESLVQKRIT